MSIAEADRALDAPRATPAAGSTLFLDEHAVIVMSDHSQTAVEERVNLAEAFADWRAC